MDASKDPGTSPENFLSMPENLVWAIILMGMMILITFVSV